MCPIIFIHSCYILIRHDLNLFDRCCYVKLTVLHYCTFLFALMINVGPTWIKKYVHYLNSRLSKLGQFAQTGVSGSYYYNEKGNYKEKSWLLTKLYARYCTPPLPFLGKQIRCPSTVLLSRQSWSSLSRGHDVNCSQQSCFDSDSKWHRIWTIHAS